MRTQEDQSFLVLNGTQTQSARVQILLSELAEIRSLGVDVMRISPQSMHTLEILQAFDAVLKGAQSAAQAQQSIAAYLPGEPCNGFWYGKPGLDKLASKTQDLEAQAVLV
jgi:collagenase-like PrtC family protease